MLLLPREIINSFEISPRSFINLSRTCTHLNKLLNPIKLRHRYLNSKESRELNIDYLIYFSDDIAVSYKEDKYYVHKLKYGINSHQIDGEKHISFEHKLVSTMVYDHMCELDQNIINCLLDNLGTKSLQPENDIIITDKYKVRLYRDDLLPYTFHFDGYYRILVGNEVYLKLAYEAAIRGKKVDILKTDLSPEALECIHHNNYINKFDNVRLIDSISEIDYDCIIGVNQDEIFIHSYYIPDICNIIMENAITLNHYPDRVMKISVSFFHNPYHFMIHHSKIDFREKSEIEWTSDTVNNLRQVIDHININISICPLCMDFGYSSREVLQKMYECCLHHGEIWQEEANRIKSKIDSL